MTTRTIVRGEQHLDEIDGYMELGMQEEALRLVRAVLNGPTLGAQDFRSCVLALLQTDEIGPWRATVEAAYRRLKAGGEDQVRSAMLNYYFSIGESKLALRFFPRRSTAFFDAWVMMQVCLELDRLDLAMSRARICGEILNGAPDEFTSASMIDALASYHLRLGNYAVALELWKNAPEEPCFERQRLCGVARARASDGPGS